MTREHTREPHLNGLMNDWAARRALPVAQAGAIRQAIVLTPPLPAPEMSVAWWQQLFGKLGGALGQVTDMSRYLGYSQTGTASTTDSNPIYGRSLAAWRPGATT